jgi:uncharacterized protein (DUF1015 family)
VPTLRPFRALRFDAAVSDLSAVLAPPYDIIGPDLRRRLLEQDPHNVVRIELPADLGTATDDDYRSAARTLEAWQRDGVLVRDAEPTVTVHRMAWSGVDGQLRTATGVLAALRLEAFGPGAGVLPHERTMGGPKQDRLRLLEETRANTSPVVLLAGGDAIATGHALARLTDRPPDSYASTADGTRHELWICTATAASELLGLLSTAPLTIADGHHRYETALAFRDARRDAAGVAAATDGPPADDPAWDYLLALVYPLDQSPPVLPTHRVIRGEPSGDDLLERLDDYARIERLDGAEDLLARMAEPPALAAGASGTGRIGLLTCDRATLLTTAALLTVKRAITDTLLPAGSSEASRGLDVNALSVIIDRAYGDEPGTMAGDGRLWYVKDAREATQQVVDEAASAAFLLDGMPPEAIAQVATAGEVMPHKSTYFNPKAPTGLAISLLEW